MTILVQEPHGYVYTEEELAIFAAQWAAQVTQSFMAAKNVATWKPPNIYEALHKFTDVRYALQKQRLAEGRD